MARRYRPKAASPTGVTVARHLVAVVDLNGPGRYLHWSIFQVSVANLVLIAVMVVILAPLSFCAFPTIPGAPMART